METPQPTTEQLEAVAHATEALASAFHEDWRKTRANGDGSFEPRVKATTDTAWTEAHGTDQVDIANTTYGDLPSDWQAENRAAAEVVVGIMIEKDGAINLSDPSTRSEVGSKIHDAWLSRNDWARGGELDAPFDELPEEEQAKDVDQVVVAQKVFEQE